MLNKILQFGLDRKCPHFPSPYHVTVPPLFIHRSTTGSSNFKGIQNVCKGSLGSKLAVNSDALEHHGYTQGTVFRTYVRPPHHVSGFEVFYLLSLKSKAYANSNLT